MPSPRVYTNQSSAVVARQTSNTDESVVPSSPITISSSIGPDYVCMGPIPSDIQTEEPVYAELNILQDLNENTQFVENHSEVIGEDVETVAIGEVAEFFGSLEIEMLENNSNVEESESVEEIVEETEEESVDSPAQNVELCLDRMRVSSDSDTDSESIFDSVCDFTPEDLQLIYAAIDSIDESSGSINQ